VFTLQEQNVTAKKSRWKCDHACIAQNYLDLHNLCKQLLSLEEAQGSCANTEARCRWVAQRVFNTCWTNDQGL